MASVHIRYDGSTQEVDFDEVFPTERLEAIGITNTAQVNSRNVSADNVKMAVAQYLDIGLGELDGYEVEFSKTGNITIRPDAVFGQ